MKHSSIAEAADSITRLVGVSSLWGTNWIFVPDAFPRLGLLVAGLSPWRPNFTPRPVNVRFVVNKVAVRQVLLVLQLSLVITIPTRSRIHSLIHSFITDAVLPQRLIASWNNTLEPSLIPKWNGQVACFQHTPHEGTRSQNSLLVVQEHAMFYWDPTVNVDDAYVETWLAEWSKIYAISEPTGSDKWYLSE